MKFDALGFVLVLFLISDMIVGLIVGIRLRGLRTGRHASIISRLSLPFFGIFLRGFCELLAYGAGYTVKPHYTTAFIAFYWLGRSALTIPCWMLMFRIMNGGIKNTSVGPGTGPVCLIVEDDKIQAKLLSELVQVAKWRADIAGSSEEALGLAHNRNYPVAFIDFRLPGMDGGKLIELLHERAPRTHVVLTATVLDDLKSIPHGMAFSVILKPPTIQSVAMMLSLHHLAA